MSDQPAAENVIDLARKFREALVKRDMAVLQDLIETYQSMYATLQDKITLLTDALAMMENPSVGGLRRLDRYKDFIKQVEVELTKYQNYVEIQIRKAVSEEVLAGTTDARRLVMALGDEAVISGRWNNLNPSVIETVLGFTREDGALFQRLSKIAPTTAKSVANALVENIGLGKNPRTIAGIITKQMGVALTDALRMTRTVQVYAYREANRASYIANSDVVTGWYWMSALDAETCTACIAMHGTFHTNDETLDDHYNGMCTMIPAVIGGKSPLEQTGEDWFKSQPEEKQRQYMGDTKYEAWKEGKFEFSALSSQHDDDVYGTMRGEATLKDLIGGG